ncbi:HET-domain-containing protein, partial [Stipitochalara longipes BDJ]
SEIRLVILESGSRDAPLRCRLIHVSLDDNPEYDALSYVWGDISVQDPAILLDGKPFQVGVNLSAALLNIRHEDLDDPKESRIWIDAICINQTNVTERNQQVQQMDRIYSRAMKVLIWLG